MLYQLKNGRTIELSVEQYLRMSVAELDNLECANWSLNVEDPFAISVLEYGPATEDKYEDEYADNVDKTIELTDISTEEKLTDSDYINTDDIDI
jgi:hypothetical protein